MAFVFLAVPHLLFFDVACVRKCLTSLGGLHPSATLTCIFHSLCLVVWDFFTCACNRPPILPLSVHWPLLLYRPDSSSKALTQSLTITSLIHTHSFSFISNLSSAPYRPLFPFLLIQSQFRSHSDFQIEEKYFLDFLMSQECPEKHVLSHINYLKYSFFFLL